MPKPLKISEEAAVQMPMAALLASAVSLVLGLFGLFHLGLAAANFTTIEYCEKRSTSGYNHPWGLGLLGNLQQTFGSGWRLAFWWLPVAPFPVRDVDAATLDLVSASTEGLSQALDANHLSGTGQTGRPTTLRNPRVFGQHGALREFSWGDVVLRQLASRH